MIKLRKMTVEEVNNKPFLINQIDDLYHYVEDSFLSMFIREKLDGFIQLIQLVRF